jgi:hypothetical protein
MQALYQIEAPRFTAGLETVNGIVRVAAPILGWAIGKRIEKIIEYCERKKWRIVQITPR